MSGLTRALEALFIGYIMSDFRPFFSRFLCFLFTPLIGTYHEMKTTNKNCDAHLNG